MENVVRARDLNPKLIDRLTKRNSSHPNQKLIDCLLSPERLWRRAFTPGRLSETGSSLFWRFFLNTPQESVYVMPLVLIFLIILFSMLQKRVGTAIPCSYCGQLFFKRIPTRFNRPLCQQCQVILQKTSKAAPELVKEKEIERARYLRRRKATTVLAGLLPFGGGFVANEQPVIGAIVSFLFFWCLSYFLVCLEIFPGLATLFFGYAGCSYFALVIAILVYLLSVFRMIFMFIREGF